MAIASMLWSYDPEHLRAEADDVQDAAPILPMPAEDAANMAYLTSLFRYRVLAEHGRHLGRHGCGGALR